MSWDTVAIVGDWHTFIGLSIVAFFLIRRQDRVLRLFGQAVAALAAFRLFWALLAATVGVDDYLASGLRAAGFFVLGAPAIIAFFLALRVGADNEPPSVRRWIMAGGALVLIAIAAARFVWPLPDETQMNPVSTMLMLFALAGAFFIALHTALEHSEGPGYAILFESAFALLLMGVAVEAVGGLILSSLEGVADADLETALTVTRLADLVASAATLVLWISVVIHERKEIARERAPRPAGD